MTLEENAVREPAPAAEDVFAGRTPYQVIGGEAGVKALTNRFYDLMDSLPAAARLRAMHADDLQPMRDALFEFLSGAFGGPALYQARPNAKCMFSAHAPFRIGEAERNQWMLCMRGALESLALDKAVADTFEAEFLKMAEALRRASAARHAGPGADPSHAAHANVIAD